MLKSDGGEDDIEEESRYTYSIEVPSRQEKEDESSSDPKETNSCQAVSLFHTHLS